MEIRILPKRVAVVLGLTITVLFCVSLASQYYKYFIGHDRHLVHLLNLDEEANVPTFYATASLLLCSGLLWLVASWKRTEGDRFVRHWLVLSTIFLLMALDEFIQFHELLSGPINSSVELGAWFHNAWVIPGILVLGVIGVTYARFLFALPRRSRILIVASAATFVCGVIGMEIISGYYSDRNGEANFTYAALTNIEETFEMIGIALLIYALMDYLVPYTDGFRVRFGSDPHQPVSSSLSSK